MSANLLRLSVIILAAVFLLYIPYRRTIQQAYDHLDSLERQLIETGCGPIEVAIRGEGEPVLVIASLDDPTNAFLYGQYTAEYLPH